MNLSAIQPGLVSLISSLAADDMRWPLPEGHVTWFGRGVPFISDYTQTGIYLRLQNTGSTGRPQTRYVYVEKQVDVLDAGGNVATQTARVLEHYRDEQAKCTLQVQAVSNENLDNSSALIWISRIRDRIREPSSRRYLKSLGMSVIRTGRIVTVERQTDDRDQSVGSLDIDLQIAHTVQGLDALPIEHVVGTGRASGSVSGVTSVDLVAGKP